MKALLHVSILAIGYLWLGSVRAEPVVGTQPTLGRLFLSPEWRDTLERQRQLNTQQARGPAAESVRLDGVVVRSSGKSTVWVNHQPRTENARDFGIVAVPSRRHPGRATVATEAQAPVDLAVGVTLNPATGEKHGGLADGEIRVSPARQK